MANPTPRTPATLLAQIKACISDNALALPLPAGHGVEVKDLADNLKKFLKATALQLCSTSGKLAATIDKVTNDVIVRGQFKTSPLNISTPKAEVRFWVDPTDEVQCCIILTAPAWKFKDSFPAIQENDFVFGHTTFSDGDSFFLLSTAPREDQKWGKQNSFTFNHLKSGLNIQTEGKATPIPLNYSLAGAVPMKTVLKLLGIDISTTLTFQGWFTEVEYGTFVLAATEISAPFALGSLKLNMPLQFGFSGQPMYPADGSETDVSIRTSFIAYSHTNLQKGLPVELVIGIPFAGSTTTTMVVDLTTGTKKPTLANLAGISTTSELKKITQGWKAVEDALDTIEFDRLSVSFDIKSKKVLRVNLAAGLTNLSTQTGYNWLSFSDVSLLFSLDRLSSGSTSKLLVDGKIALATQKKPTLLDYNLNIVKPTGEPVQLSLAAGMEPVSQDSPAIKVPNLVKKIGGDVFNSVSYGPLKSGTITDLGIAGNFGLAKGDAADFHLQYSMALDETTAPDLRVSMKVDVKRDKGAAPTGSLAATLEIGYTTLAVDFEKGTDSVFVASFTESDKQSLALEDILNTLNIDIEAPVLDVAFTAATFGYDSTSKLFFLYGTTADGLSGAFASKMMGAKREYALVTKLNKKADWSISLSSIPVIGDSLHALTFDLKNPEICLLSNKTTAFKSGDFSPFSSISEAHNALQLLADLDGLTNDITLRCTLDINDYAIPINIPIGQSAGASTQGTASTGKDSAPSLAAVAEEDTPGESSTEKAAPDKVPVGRSFGPLHISHITFNFANTKQSGSFGHLSMELDASVNLGPFSLDLFDLTIGSDLSITQTPAPTFALEGMALNYQSPAFSITGAFLKAGSGIYDGEFQVKMEEFGLFAVGSYQQMSNGDVSMFIFLMVDAVLGGPPFMVVTGLAGGFGYNNNLKLPKVDEVESYPLVQGAGAGSSNPFKEASLDNIGDNFAVLNQWLTAEKGENWVAAGAQFTSFDILNTFALLTIKFGTDFEIGVIGISRMQDPPVVPPEEAFVRVGLAIEASYQPDDGVLQVNGLLSSDSFIYSYLCKLHGGFAYYSWFKDQGPNLAPAGDYVLSIGGYSPLYSNKPKWYPEVPRLGVSWQIDEHTHMGMDAYFALTPNVIMFGGNASLNWGSGPFSIWFDAGLDFLINFQPFHYKGDAYIHMGASAHVHIWPVTVSVSVHLGVDVDFQGPDLSGTAHVDLGIVSFDVNFGDKKSVNTAHLPWNEFAQKFLPDQKGNMAMAGTYQGNAICTINAQKGIRKSDPKQPKAVTVDASDPFSFTINSRIPSTSIAQVYGSKSPEDVDLTDYTALQHLGTPICGISKGDFKADTTITFKPSGEIDGDPADLPIGLIAVQTLNAAPAMWGPKTPGLNDSTTPLILPNGLVIGSMIKAGDCTQQASIANLQVESTVENCAFFNDAVPPTTHPSAWNKLNPIEKMQSDLTSHQTDLQKLAKAVSTQQGVPAIPINLSPVTSTNDDNWWNDEFELRVTAEESSLK